MHPKPKIFEHSNFSKIIDFSKFNYDVSNSEFVWISLSTDLTKKHKLENQILLHNLRHSVI